MRRLTFKRRLALFFGPLGLVFFLPIAVLLRTWEIMPVSWIARAHASGSSHAVYGPAYSNPDKGYKAAAIRLREPPIVAVGSSRVMELRADLFLDGESDFYNGGGTVSRVWDLRHLQKRLRSTRTRRLVVGLDPWWFNAAFSDYAPDPGVAGEYDGEYSTLDTVQKSLRVYADVVGGKVSLQELLFAESSSFGVNGITHQNGFARDGSYVYSDLLRAQAVRPGLHDDDVMARIRTGTRRFEPADHPAPAALDELSRVAEEWKQDGFEVVAFMPPFAPSVVDAIRRHGRLNYVFEIGPVARAILAAKGIPVVDLTSCDTIACRDDDFVDGFHGGTFLYAKVALALSQHAVWLHDRLDRASIERRLSAPRNAWELPYD